jgi:hypothetical protein
LQKVDLKKLIRERVASAALNEEAVTLSDEMKNDGLAG